jgi:hypothetical protein
MTQYLGDLDGRADVNSRTDRDTPVKETWRKTV